PSTAPAQPVAALAGEAICFDHPNKRAVSACHQCGRFVCQLCAVEFGAETLCPSCVAAGSGRAAAANLEPSRTLYDSLALAIPLGSLVVWPLTALAAPAAVVFTFMRWSRPLSLVRRSRWRFFAAILIGLAEIAGWVWALAYFVARYKAGRT
ncbi:MAG: B-box zinc finger protein, partial [Opitutales bacterium]